MIAIYYNDPVPPHFHAIYGEFEAVIDIADGSLWAGKLPERAVRMVKRWARDNRAQLMENWERCRQQLELKQIAGLE